MHSCDLNFADKAISPKLAQLVLADFAHIQYRTRPFYIGTMSGVSKKPMKNCCLNPVEKGL